MPEKILLTGGRGMLGRSISAVLNKRFEIVQTDLPEVDITNQESLSYAVERYAPDAVIHCAAMTAVDLCESHREKAFLLNETGCVNVAQICRKNDIRLLAVSTDYVFDGEKKSPYGEDDPANGGRTVYGQSKFAGERAIQQIYPEKSLICRTSWLYGPGGPSFVHTMLSLADGSRPEIKVVSDQIGNPTSSISAASKLGELLENPDLTGIVHLSCEGEASWYDFALEIFRQRGITQKVIPCTTAEFPRPAPRPLNSRLQKNRLREWGLAPMPEWKEALREFLALEFAK